MSSPHNLLNFFRIILPLTLEQGKLPLPTAFGKKYGKTLSSTVLIKLPNGGKWEMNWTMHDGQIWLENGWKEFVKFYSISVGYFLVFKYEGNSHFQVLIFDSSCLEIAYPVLLGIDDDESNKSDSAEVIRACNKARPKLPVPCPRPHKSARTNPLADPDYFNHLDHNVEISRFGRKSREKNKTHLDIDSAQKRFKGNGGGSFSFEKHSKREISRSKEPLSFQNLFSFDVQMYRTYLTRNCLRFPQNHGMNCLNKNEGTVILRVSDGKTWPVSYKFSNGRGTLTNGWLSFVRENNLKLGDVCNFKIIESNGDSFFVSIRRVNEMSYSPSSQGEWATDKLSSAFYEQVPPIMYVESEVEKTCNQFKSDNGFPIFIRSCLLENTRPSIPMDFIRRYIRHKEQCVILQVGRKSCLVKLAYNPNKSYARFTTGWSPFVRECGLKAGDVCHFQLIDEDEGKLVLKVSVEERHDQDA